MERLNRGTILYIGGFELPDKNAAAQRVLANAKLFRKVGYETILLGIDKDIEYDTPILKTQIEYEGFSMYSIPYPKSLKQWTDYLTDASKYLEFAEGIENLKSVICYNFPSVPLDKIRKYYSKLKVNCIADVTEWYSGKGRPFLIKIVKGIDTFYRMRIVQKKMDALIVISKYLAEYYRECHNVVYIPPLTDFKNLVERGKREKTHEGLKLVYAGCPGLKDRINLLIEAISRVKRKVFLDIIGISESEYLSMYPEHKTLLTSNIVFHGRLPHDLTVDYIRKADFSCFFRYEDRVTKAGFPTKFSEAISLGTPVFTNKSSNIDEYIYESVNGILVKTLSIDEIAKNLEKVAATDISVDVETFNYQRYVTKAKELLG